MNNPEPEARLIERLEKQARNLAESDHPAEAETLYRQICTLEPENPSRWIALGNILEALDRASDALDCYREATGLDPASVAARLALAGLQRNTGDIKGAIRSYQRLLQLDAGHFEALGNLGMLYYRTGDHDSAIPYLQRALALQPDHAIAHIILGEIMTAKSAYSEALEHLRHAVNIAPDLSRGWLALANAQHHAGLMQDALDSYDTLEELSPDSDNPALGKARILEQMGKSEETYELLKPLLARGNNDAIHTFFNISKQLNRREQAVAALENILSGHDGHRKSDAAVHFKLGKHYDEYGDYARAFRHYRLANELTDKGFNTDRLVRFVDDSINVYSREFVARMPRARNRSKLPVFILGMPRSGTSLLEQILASHPDITGAGELPHIPGIVNRLAAGFPGYVYPLFVPVLSEDILSSTADQHIRELASLGGSDSRVIDKLPHNFRNVGLISQLFPAARIIHCTRHPLDTCLSCYFARFGTETHGYSYNLKSLGQFYLQYRRLMDHWEKVLGERILTVSYRELVMAQEETTRNILDFCGMEWDERCLEFHDSGLFVFTLSYDQVRQPIYTASLDRWKHYERQLQPLRDLLESGGVDCNQAQ